MTAEELAALHARCFTVPRAYTAAEFAGFLDMAGCFLCERAGGFALGRALVGEAELLTLAVDPGQRRGGLGRSLLAKFEGAAMARGAETAFLEVAAGNAAALGLYRAEGYRESGRRRGYYRLPNGQKEDAILMEKLLRQA